VESKRAAISRGGPRGPHFAGGQLGDLPLFEFQVPILFLPCTNALNRQLEWLDSMSTPSLFQDDPRIELNITLEWSKRRITFDWLVRHTDKKLAHGAVWAADSVLQWRITGDGEPENFECLIEPLPIEVAVRNVAGRFPVAKRDVKVFGRRFSAIMNQWEKKQIDKVRDPWEFVAIEVLRMGEELASSESWLAPAYDDFDLAPDTLNFLERKARREEKNASSGKRSKSALPNPAGEMRNASWIFGDTHRKIDRRHLSHPTRKLYRRCPKCGWSPRQS